ncbi:unnamed protein product [Citrullus colocynthis]|uniref:Secreted protein n=1 Tax=Citrullus colocynthis TaxID=252529 RepID=A0ABP0XPJ7_9ROSI
MNLSLYSFSTWFAIAHHTGDEGKVPVLASVVLTFNIILVEYSTNKQHIIGVIGRHHCHKNEWCNFLFLRVAVDLFWVFVVRSRTQAAHHTQIQKLFLTQSLNQRSFVVTPF